MRRKLEREVPTRRITADDNVRRRDALLEEMGQGCVGLSQLGWEGRVGS